MLAPMRARLLLGLVLSVGAVAVLSQAAAAKHVKVNAALMKTLDPDTDGTVSLAEAKAAGAAMFKKLDKDNDGTLDAKELKGRVDKAEFKDADPDKDGTLSDAEYAALVEKLFKARRHRQRRHAQQERIEVEGGPEAAPAHRLSADPAKLEARPDQPQRGGRRSRSAFRLGRRFEELGRARGEVGEDPAGACALEGDEAFHHHGVALEPAGGGRRL